MSASFISESASERYTHKVITVRERMRIAADERGEGELLMIDCTRHAFSDRESYNERNIREMDDPDWLQIVGHPTIPHTQSLRAPPAQVALHPKKEKLIGLTSKEVSKRYLDRLQKERLKNKEVLLECVDNLPITIKQMVYPEKPKHRRKAPLSDTGGISVPSQNRFRLGARPAADYWEESQEHWTDVTEKENHTSVSEHISADKRSQNGSSASRRDPRLGSHHSGSTHSRYSSESGQFVHHPGFQGGHSHGPKYTYGKSPLSNKSSSTASTTSQAPFRPKGFGALYDEMEFQRRYKKVFDLNKHIHFVHSNFLSGQRIVKRTKLPPIGSVQGVQSETPDQMDIFAIMSVQKYNHPESHEIPKAPAVTPGRQKKGAGGDDKDVYPPGFVPGLIRDPFRGIDGPSLGSSVSRQEPSTVKISSSNPMDTLDFQYRLPSFTNENPIETAARDIEALGTLKENENSVYGPEDGQFSSHRDVIEELSKQKDTPRTSLDKSKKKTKRKRGKSISDNRAESSGNDTDTVGDDIEPFNIRVHVEIKPREENGSPQQSKQGGIPSHDDQCQDGDRTPVAESRESETPTYDKTGTDSVIYKNDTRNNQQNDKDSQENSGYISRTMESSSDRLKTELDENSNIDKVDQSYGRIYSNGEDSDNEMKVSENMDYLRVPSTPDSKPPSTAEGERVKVLSRSSSSCSGHSVPEIRMTCATPVPPQMLNE